MSHPCLTLSFLSFSFYRPPTLVVVSGEGNRPENRHRHTSSRSRYRGKWVDKRRLENGEETPAHAVKIHSEDDARGTKNRSHANAQYTQRVEHRTAARLHGRPASRISAIFRLAANMHTTGRTTGTNGSVDARSCVSSRRASRTP